MPPPGGSFLITFHRSCVALQSLIGTAKLDRKYVAFFVSEGEFTYPPSLQKKRKLIGLHRLFGCQFTAQQKGNPSFTQCSGMIVCFRGLEWLACVFPVHSFLGCADNPDYLRAVVRVFRLRSLEMPRLWMSTSDVR